MILGLPFGAFVVLLSVIGFGWYAHREPGVQSLGFFWGAFIGTIACYLVLGMQNTFSGWVRNLLETLTHPPIDSPDFVSSLSPYLGFAALFGAAYLIVTKVGRVARPTLKRA